MNVLVVGFGSMGRRRAAASLALDHTVGVFDPALSIAVDGITLFADLSAALASRPKAVFIATPAHTHADLLARVLFETDAHVLVEKPLALIADDVTPLVSQIGPDRLVRVGCNWRFHRAVDEVKARIARRAEPCVAAFVVESDMSTWPGSTYADGLLECGAHELDLARYLFGQAEVVSCERGISAWQVGLTHRDGSVSSVLINGAARQPRRGVRIVWPNALDGYHVTHDKAGLAEVSSSYAFETRAFLDAVDGRPSAIEAATFDDGVAVLGLISTARQQAIFTNI